MLLVSVTFYQWIENRHSKPFLQHFSTFVETLLKSCRKITALSCINFFIGFKIWSFSEDISAYDYYILVPFLFIIGQRTIQKQLKCHLKPEHRHLVKEKCFTHLFILI